MTGLPHRLRVLLAASLLLLAAPTALGSGAGGGPDVPELYAIRTAHFVFTFHEENRRAVEPLAARAEAVRNRVCLELGLVPATGLPCFDGPIRVHVSRDAAEFHGTRPGGGTPPPDAHVDWAVGVAFADHDLVLLRIDRLALLDLYDTFVHEVSHIALRQGVSGRFLPRWFMEGVAIHQADEDVVQRFESASRASLTDSLIPIRDLVFRFPDRPARVHLAYAESVLYLRWLLAEIRPHGHVAVVARVAAGDKFHDAFEAVFGDTPDELFDLWSRSLRERSSWIPVVTGTGFLWGLLTVVFVWTWWRKRREMREMMARWEAEEDERPREWYEPD